MILVGLIEDKQQYSQAVKHWLSETSDMSLAGIWPDAESAIKEIPDLLPDVVLTDLQLPGMNGIECIRRLKKECPGVQFLVLTVFEDDDKVFEALKLGATGYLLKGESTESLLSAIKEIHHGGSPMSPGIARKVIRFFQNTELHADMGTLTKRETDALQLLAEGKLYKEIGAEMGITIYTVKKHLKNIYHKLHVQNKVEAVLKWKSI